MKLLTIGEFARAARLSPKALRLYDELGLLRPDAVDTWSGYRYYAPSHTAMYWTGSRLALVHIGDTRAYLLRDGGLFQVTHDDSVTQSMVDAGLLTPEEATSHPQRSLLLKAIGAADDGAQTPALSLHDARSGDRYLLASDGLTSVVPVPVIRAVLRDASLSPQDVVARLIALANEAGGPDNIACAVADITEAA